MDDPREGIDYLTDHYAVLDIDRKYATPEIIRDAHKSMQMLYHPDRYESLAPEFQARAVAKSKIISESNAILSNPEKRATYDDQLDNWEGAISTNGFPVIDLFRSYFSPAPLLSPGSIDDTDNMRQKVLEQFSTYNPATFTVIERTYLQSEKPDHNLVAAYIEQLMAYNIHLSLQEGSEWQKIGFQNPLITGFLSTAQEEKTSQQLADAKQTASDGITKALLMIASGEIKNLKQGDEPVAIDDIQSAKLRTYQNQALERFGAAEQNIQGIAQKRAAIAEKLLTAIMIEYVPEQSVFRPQLIINAQTKEKNIWFRCTLKNMTLTIGTIDNTDVAEKNDKATAEKWVAKEHSVIFFKVQNGLEPTDQIRHVAAQHFDKITDPRSDPSDG